MNKPNYCKYLGYVDSKKYIDFIKKHVNFSCNNDYGREEFFSECKNFFLLDNFEPKNSESLEIFYNISEDIKNVCTSYYGSGVIERIQFSLVPAKAKIKKHYDYGLQFSLSHRIHLPIITNKNVNFHIYDKIFNFKINQLVEINNKKEHYVENNSDTDRIHLIIDFIPLKFLPYLR